jgi:hypothetical protein
MIRYSIDTSAGIMLLMTCGALMLSVIGAAYRPGNERPRWLGAAVLGWGYFALAHWYSYHQGPVPTLCFLPGAAVQHSDLLSLPPIVRIGQYVWTLLAAMLGGWLAGRLFPAGPSREPRSASIVPGGAGLLRFWKTPAAIGVLTLGVVAVVWLAGGRWDPGIAAGTAFLLAWALVGVEFLGAVGSRGRRREAWLGAAAFGLGYLLLAFGPVASGKLPTTHLLNAVFCPEGPKGAIDVDDDPLTTDEESRRVRRALDEPVALEFPQGTALGVVLDRIKAALRKPLGKEPIIHTSRDDGDYNPQVFDRWVVSIDGENIPAKDALLVCLGQCGLRYRVQSDTIRIFPEAYRPIPFRDDPVMILGHSILAIVAAAVGGVAGPIVAGFCGRHGPTRGATGASGPRSSLAAPRTEA